jgi:hypothetical protein
MNLVPCKFDPEYSVAKLTVIIQSPKQQRKNALYDSNIFFFRTITKHLIIALIFSLQKYMCELFCGSGILLIFGYFRICAVTECFSINAMKPE